jgi:hypothetical protein
MAVANRRYAHPRQSHLLFGASFGPLPILVGRLPDADGRCQAGRAMPVAVPVQRFAAADPPGQQALSRRGASGGGRRARRTAPAAVELPQHQLLPGHAGISMTGWGKPPCLPPILERGRMPLPGASTDHASPVAHQGPAGTKESGCRGRPTRNVLPLEDAARKSQAPSQSRIAKVSRFCLLGRGRSRKMT